MPLLEGNELKNYEDSPFVEKYYVESLYDYIDGTDYEVISRAREIDITHDGECCSSSHSNYRFKIYDSLIEALNNLQKRIDLVEFENLSDDEMIFVEKVTRNKMHDWDYLSKYGLTPDCCY